jgi:adhesin transport system membrane fusion protein
MLVSTSDEQRDLKRRANRIIWTLVMVLLALAVWAYMALLDEVAVGEGRVTPTSQSQVIQVVDGGVLASLSVREGQQVEQGQILAVLDPERSRSQYEKRASEVTALKAAAARLLAEINHQDVIVFPQDVLSDYALIQREMDVRKARKFKLENELRNIGASQHLAQQELRLLEPLLARGATTEVEILRLRQKISEQSGQMQKLRDEFDTKAKEEYAKVSAEIEANVKGIVELENRVSSTIITSPVRGVVKQVDVNTLGGVIKAGDKLMEIIPSDDQLRIEAKINPRDIAFIHPGQEAIVKISAYDSSIYGFLRGKVVFIAPDTIRDEVHKDQVFYVVYVSTDNNFLQTPIGQRYLISAGMVATVEIKTGQRTVMNYLLKPINKAADALRER